ncbi:hypothetical protein KAR91_63880 [Candidatus Pacearchaeota archaeon]|nr:hypothetical protein [Candidatus Pacearchaeota archaeon]
MIGKSKQNGKNEIIQLKTPVEFALEGIDKIDKHLKALDKEHKGLVIREGNKQDYEAVRLAIKARRELRGKVSVETKSLKDDSLKYARACNAEEKRINEWILKRETELKAEKKKEDDRIQTIKDAEAEAEETRKKAIREKIAAIKKLGINAAMLSIDEINAAIEKLDFIDPDPEEYAEFTPEAMETKTDTSDILARAKGNRIQLDREESDRKAEADRLEKERKKLADQKAEQDEKDEELKAAQKNIDDQKAEVEAALDKAMESKPADNEKSNHGYISGNVSETIAKRSESQPEQKPATENGALRHDAEQIRKFAENIKNMDIPELNNESLIAIFEIELFNINECINRLLERIE